MKRVVSTLLMQVDSLPDNVILIVASNHPGLLDIAAGRRFQYTISLPAPTPEQIKAVWDRYEFEYSFNPLQYGFDNFSQVVDFCEHLRRRRVFTEPVQALLETLDWWKGKGALRN